MGVKNALNITNSSLYNVSTLVDSFTGKKILQIEMLQIQLLSVILKTTTAIFLCS